MPRRRRKKKSCKDGYRKDYSGECVKKKGRKEKDCGTGYKKDWMTGDCIKVKRKLSRKKRKSKDKNIFQRIASTDGFRSFFSNREGYRNKKKRQRPPKEMGESILATVKIFLNQLVSVIVFVFIVSGWMHLTQNIDTYIPYPNMNKDGGLAEVLQKVGKIIRTQAGGGKNKVQKGGALRPGEVPNNTRWFKEGAFFDTWAGDGKPPPDWMKQMQNQPSMFSRGIGHYFQTFRDIPILLILMEGVKMVKGFTPERGSGTSLADLLSLTIVMPIFYILLTGLHALLNIGSIWGGIFYRQDMDSWIPMIFLWPFCGPFGMLGSLIVYLLIVFMPNYQRASNFFKYFSRYSNIWFLLIFSFTLNEVLKVFDIGLDINRWNTNHKAAIIPVIVLLSLVIIKSIRDLFNYVL